jgi:hypothetical protein
MQPQKLTRAEQARVNGAKSRGATTPEGIQRCRLINIKHGGYVAAAAVIPGEDPKKYEGLLLSLEDQYKPRNLAEFTIVHSLADAIWRQRRLINAANYEIQRQMFLAGDFEPGEEANLAAIHLAAETGSPVIHRLEARVRHQTREIARLQRILQSMQKYDVSDETSQMSKEILDLALENLERETAASPKPAPKEPPPPGRQLPRPENLSRLERKQLRQ